MNKKSKISLSIFVGIFVIPEILWSPIGNFIYQLGQTGNSGGTFPFRNNFLNNPDNTYAYVTILFIQFLGLLLTTFYIAKYNISAKKNLLWLLIVLLTILSVLIFLIFYWVATFRGIR